MLEPEVVDRISKSSSPWKQYGYEALYAFGGTVADIGAIIVVAGTLFGGAPNGGGGNVNNTNFEAAPEVEVTMHGATRVAGPAATRGGVLSIDAINVTKTMGRAFPQSDGATIYLHEITPGRFNAVVEGTRGIITTMENWSLKSINRIAKNYGWECQ